MLSRAALVLLALMGISAAAAAGTGKALQKGRQKNLAVVGAVVDGLPGLTFGLAASTCDMGYTECDDDWCIPLTGTCCKDGNGTYRALGKYCIPGGCCQLGNVCGSVSDECDVGQEECGGACMPEGAVCCRSGGYYCDSGEACLDDYGYCDRGGSDDDDKSANCTSLQDECDGLCMPAGSVCCNDGEHYCDAGRTCVADGTCRRACDVGKEPCGDEYCMPEGSVCCGDGYYCDAGRTCTANGKCHNGSRTGGDEGGATTTYSMTSAVTRTAATATTPTGFGSATATETSFSASSTEEEEPVGTATSSPSSGSQRPRPSSVDGLGGGGNDDRSGSDSGADNNDGPSGEAGRLGVSGLAVGIVCALILGL